MNKSVIANIAFLVFWLVGVPLIGLAVSAHNFTADCDATGGHVSTEGFTSWCRY